MQTEDQQEVIAFLSCPATVGDGCKAVRRTETQISIVFIGDQRVLKLKRAIKLPFLDFSTVEQRREACEAEVALNRRTAPDLYQGACPIRRAVDGGLRLGGDGEVVDWVVDMRRFDEDTLLDRVAQRGGLDRHLMEDLAAAVADLHAKAEPRHDFGGREGIAGTMEGNAAALRQVAEGILGEEEVERVILETQEAFGRYETVLAARRDGGLVRRCHGDLHLRNIFLAEGRPTLFDAIEFSDLIAVIDVFYDLAFLLMDLDRRGLRPLANLVLNRYLDITGDTGGLRPLPLFLAMRATIRAFVSAGGAKAIGDGAEEATLVEDARTYLSMATEYLRVPTPRLIAIGGLSGTGKSRLARVLAPELGTAPGARIARSDALRKRLAGVDPMTRLGPDGYSVEMTERTYARVLDEARDALQAGQAVIADAVFARPEQRSAIEAIAREAGVPFLGLWLEAPVKAMADRVTRRQRNVSDATVDVVRKQLDYELGDITWSRVDTGGSRHRTAELARAAVWS